jgi:hypothetical protein
MKQKPTAQPTTEAGLTEDQVVQIATRVFVRLLKKYLTELDAARWRIVITILKWAAVSAGGILVLLLGRLAVHALGVP